MGEEQEHYVFIKDLNTFMYDHILHRGRKHSVAIVFKLLAQKKY